MLRLLNTADKLYDTAKKAYLDGDEERAYVLFMRFFELTKVIQKSADYKKDPEYYKKMMGVKRMHDAVTSCQSLSDSLIERYNLLNEASKIDSELKQKEVKDALEDEKKRKEQKDGKTLGNKSKSLSPGINGVVKPNSTLNETEKDKILQESGVMTVRNLKSLLDQKATRFLAIDCRSNYDFTRGRIIHSNCINIPSDILHPG